MDKKLLIILFAWVCFSSCAKQVELTKSSSVYRALISQENEYDPVVSVLENEIGVIVWRRETAGVYYGTLSNSFPEDKTFIINGSGKNGLVFSNVIDINTVAIATGIIDTGENIDNRLDNTTIEIRVYP